MRKKVIHKEKSDVYDDVKKIIALAKKEENQEDFKALGIFIILYTGMSVAEVTALEWSKINFKTSIITVSQTATRVWNTEQCKTERVIEKMENPRKVPMNIELKEVLKKYHSRVPKKEAYVLSNSAKLCEARIFQAYLKRLACDLDKNYTPTNLRDYFFIIALKSGMNPLNLSAMTGVGMDHICMKYKELIQPPTDKENLKELKKIKF